MPAAKAAWIALAAWMGFVGGVAWQQRAVIKPVPETQRSAVLAKWAAWYAKQAHVPGQALMAWSEPSACACSDSTAAAELLHRASTASIDVVPVADGQRGIALFDAEGRLRYAGAADALAFCSTEKSLNHWLENAAAPAAVMVSACPCDESLSL